MKRIREMRRLLEIKTGAVVEDVYVGSNGHPRVRLRRGDAVVTMIVAMSPSDRRATANMVSTAKKLLRDAAGAGNAEGC